MKLSDSTITTLKNFANINQSMMFRKGKIQSTVEVDEHVAAIAELDEFPQDFGIYDLNQFLANVSTLNSPDLSFGEKSLTMTDGKITMTYNYCDPDIIEAEPVDDLTIDDPDVEFSLEKETYQKIIKLAGMNDLPVLSFIGKDGKLKCVAENLTLKDASQVSFVVGDYEGKDFKGSFNLNYLNILPNDYSVKIKENEFGIFASPTVTYLIALEIQPKGSK